jgi:tetratricopeptide (TPR) repeat protein
MQCNFFRRFQRALSAERTKSSEDLIPGNSYAMKRLKALIQNGSSIAFIGAGASAGLYPLWSELLRALIQAVMERGLASKEDSRYWLKNIGLRPQQVARAVRAKLGDSTFGEQIRSIFGPKRSPSGAYYTDIHGRLVKLPFRGLITTNYDPGLLEARLSLRPDVRATGYATWKDPDTVQRWLTAEIFKEEQLPILFVHGIYQRSDTIILGVSEYRHAYGHGLYKRLIEKLWSQENLIFVGFGFSDPWLTFIADEVLTETSVGASEPRHVAIVGLPESETYTPEMRELFRDQYGCAALFYPVVTKQTADSVVEDHSALSTVLGDLGQLDVQIEKEIENSENSPSPITDSPPQHWSHETTDDDLYVEPSAAIAKLTRWCADLSVHAIAVVGMGGLGKTALVGHWLKKCNGASHRIHRGLFFWSFYADKRVDSLFDSLINFAASLEKANRGFLNELSRSRKATLLLKLNPLIIVLDGLEVLQEQPGLESYGELLQGELRDFIDEACRVEHTGLMVLTSRFPFADLTVYAGTSLRNLELDALTPAEGSALLKTCGVSGGDERRRAIAQSLHGHPLAIRVLAASCRNAEPSESDALIGEILSDPDEEASSKLEAKLRRLLLFYESCLGSKRSALLGALGLFRTAVSEKTLFQLCTRLSETVVALHGYKYEVIAAELGGLHKDGILSRDIVDGEVTYAAHPVLRDHFRRGLLDGYPNVADDFAEFLFQRPSASGSFDSSALELTVTAVEILTYVGEFAKADEVYQTRLEGGRVFQWLPALDSGIRCVRGFVVDAQRRKAAAEALTEERLASYFSVLALCAAGSGDLGLASQSHLSAISIYERGLNPSKLSVAHRNFGDLRIISGVLREAQSAMEFSLKYAAESNDIWLKVYAISHLAHVMSLQGQVQQAADLFESATTHLRQTSRYRSLYSLSGLLLSEFLIKANREQDAKRISSKNLQICQRNGWHNQEAQCHISLGRIAVAERDFGKAREHFSAAERIIERGHLVGEKIHLNLSMSQMSLIKGDHTEAVRLADATLRLAGPRGFRLAQVESLCVDARAKLQNALSGINTPQLLIQRALDSAESALALAIGHQYHWGQYIASGVLVRLYETLHNDEKAFKFRKEEGLLGGAMRGLRIGDV